MKLKLKFRLAFIAANLVCITVSVILLLIGAAKGNSQQSQFAAERWKSGSSDMEYAQLSLFFREGTFDSNSINMFRNAIAKAMTNASLKAEENTRLWIDSYSGEFGKLQAQGTKKTQSECTVTVTGGDFFIMRGFRLQSGSFYGSDSLMQDGAVIDGQLAWQLFGSDNVSGMTFTLGGKSFYVSGVIEQPSTNDEKACAGDAMRAYISYGGATYLQDGNEFTKTDSYETVLPNTVENFAMNILKKAVENRENDVLLVKNTDRFAPVNMLSNLKNLKRQVVRSEAMALPWWENSARMTEFSLAFIFLFSALILTVPIITAAVILIKAFLFSNRNRHRVIPFIIKQAKKVFLLFKNKIRRKKHEK